MLLGAAGLPQGAGGPAAQPGESAAVWAGRGEAPGAPEQQDTARPPLGDKSYREAPNGEGGRVRGGWRGCIFKPGRSAGKCHLSQDSR